MEALPFWSSGLPVLVLVSLPILAYCWAIRRNAYWRRQNVPNVPSTPFFGNFAEPLLGRKSIAQMFRDIYEHPKFRSSAVVGIEILHQPAIFVRDPELARSILIKDFSSFSERYAQAGPHDTLGNASLFFARNRLWRRLRVRLTSFFSSGRLRKMFPLINQVAMEMDRQMSSMKLDNVPGKSFVAEVKDFAARYTTDVIASCAFGVQANSLNDPESEFRRNGRAVFDFNWYRSLEFTSLFFLPGLVKTFGFHVFSKEPQKFIRNTISYVMDDRERSKANRDDLIDTLIEMKEEDLHLENPEFSGDVLVAQAGIFFTAGFETSSTLMSFGLFELAQRPDVQTRLRQEIKETFLKNNGEMNYAAILGMEYLHMVISEILRLHPILPFLDRRHTPKDGETGYSLQPFHSFVIPKEMPVIIPVGAIQRDPKFFPNPNYFDPERFAPENKDNIVPYTFMPFGVGPHNCIGERLGYLQSKLGLVNILKNHYVTPSDRTPSELVYSKKSVLLQTNGGLFLNMVRDALLE